MKTNYSDFFACKNTKFALNDELKLSLNFECLNDVRRSGWVCETEKFGGNLSSYSFDEDTCCAKFTNCGINITADMRGMDGEWMLI